MTEQDERLQRAWLALCGWRVGMVTMDGVPVQSWWLEDPTAGYKLKDRLPALDSPANWGHWLVWMTTRAGSWRLKPACGGWWTFAKTGYPGTTSASGPPAEAMMRAFVRHALQDTDLGLLDPAVREWWEGDE